MKIIIVAPSLDPSKNVSGISSVTKFIVSNNKENEYIHFVLGRKDDEKGGVFRIFSILEKLREWKKMLNKEKDAIIHYNFPLSKPSILRDPLFMGMAMRQKRKMVIHIHGGVFLTHYEEAPFFFKWILKKVFRWNVPFIVLGENEKNIIKQSLKTKKVFSLPNCIDLQDAELFKRVYSDSKPLIIGYIGRIAETKGMIYLLKACRELKNKQIPFVLKLAGAEEVGDSFLPLFENYLGNQFTYSGVVSGEKKNDFLKSLDVFVLPSYFEGLPMSLLECMSYGVVPITTNVGSIGDVVEDCKNGFFIKVKDAESIVDVLTRLNSDRELLSRLGDEARATIFNNFNPHEYIQNLNIIYGMA